jgi:hypothetical protein
MRAALEAGDMERVGALWRSARSWRAAAERDGTTSVAAATR